MNEVKIVARYVREVHRRVAKFVVRAGNLSAMDRWNFIQSISEVHSNASKAYSTSAPTLAAKVDRSRRVAAKDGADALTIEEADRAHFMDWAEKQKPTTAFEPFGCEYRPSSGYSSMTRQGDAFTPTSVLVRSRPSMLVTAKYPSGWIGNLSHETLYSEPLQLIRNDSKLIREANFSTIRGCHQNTLQR